MQISMWSHTQQSRLVELPMCVLHSVCHRIVSTVSLHKLLLTVSLHKCSAPKFSTIIQHNTILLCSRISCLSILRCTVWYVLCGNTATTTWYPYSQPLSSRFLCFLLYLLPLFPRHILRQVVCSGAKCSSFVSV